jgi:hypothetical protein
MAEFDFLEKPASDWTHDEMSRAVDLADRIIRADYWRDVHAIVTDVTDEIKAGRITTPDELDTYVHETVDGHHNVIYTYAARRVLMASDNVDAWEDVGFENPTVEQQAFCAMRADVLDMLGADLDVSDADEWPTPENVKRAAEEAAESTDTD